MSIYCYAKADQMVEHRFTDDVALVRAFTKRQAIEKFRGYYTSASKDDVFKVKLRKKVYILTDY